MRIALVNFDIFQGRTTGLYPPLHLCALGTSLEDAGHEVRVFDYCGLFRNIDPFFREIADFNPSAVGLTCYTPYIGRFHELTTRLRSFVPNSALIVGGAHSTVWPQWSLKTMPQFDYAMVGEADRSIVEFAEMLDGKRSEADIPGLVYRCAGAIHANERQLIKELDVLPQVRRSLLNRYYQEGRYWDMAARGNLDMMITSRGCPYSCSFCFKLERKYRYRGVEHLMIEFEELRRRGVRSIHIQDDAFTANGKRCLAVAEELIKGKYRFELKIRSRVNNVNAELLSSLKRCGVRQIIYGFESGSQDVLKSMDKHTTVEMNERAVEMTRDAGIACYGEIMIGMPGETPDTLRKTTEFLLKYKPIVGRIPVLYPLPGTKVYEEAKANGTLRGDWTVEGQWPWVKLAWTETRDQLEREAARMSNTLQRDPAYVVYFLRHHIRLMRGRHLAFLGREALRLLRQ
jgi:anaerobic magnesium-protoporphyrin IX monomethyl ester cyclase